MPAKILPFRRGATHDDGTVGPEALSRILRAEQPEIPLCELCECVMEEIGQSLVSADLAPTPAPSKATLDHYTFDPYARR